MISVRTSFWLKAVRALILAACSSMTAIACKVASMRFLSVLPVLAVALAYLGVAKAEILSFRKVGDKAVTCMHSGMISDLNFCGKHDDWYSYMFVGHISSIKPAKDDEKVIQIVPEEVFYGKPDNPMTVLTSQGLCLPHLAVGDRWLFYLRKVNGKPIILDYYGNDSLPVAEARTQIDTLRRLKKIGEFGILRGRVVRGESFDGKAVSNAQVVANRRSDNKQFVAVTDSVGHYEFQPLPPGKYKVTVRPIGSYQPDDSGIELIAGACWDLTLSKFSNAQIGGHVKRPNGAPVTGVGLLLIRSDNTWYQKTQTDGNGHFHFDQHEPGEYVLGLNLPGSPGWVNGSAAGAGIKIPQVSLFYPNAKDRSSARVIRVSDDEKLDSLDFIVPVH
jgi:hypothetical protein